MSPDRRLAAESRWVRPDGGPVGPRGGPSAAERWSWRLCIAMAMSLAACMVLWLVDPRTLDNGESVWVKPMRFSLAFGVHLATMLWLAHLGRGPQQPLHPAFGQTLAPV